MVNKITVGTCNDCKHSELDCEMGCGWDGCTIDNKELKADTKEYEPDDYVFLIPDWCPLLEGETAESFQDAAAKSIIGGAN